MKKHPTSHAIKKARTVSSGSSHSQRFMIMAVAILVAVVGVITLLFSHAATTNTVLYVSPASQVVTSGTDVVVSITIDTGPASINTVQTVVNYSSTNFTFVSMTPGAAFGAAFPNSATPGSIQFSAGSTTPVTGVQTVATITLHATATGTSPISVASVCPAGNFSATCSAAYDSGTSANVLAMVTSGSYTVNPVPVARPTVPANLHSTATTAKSISLAWDASTDAGGPGIAGYRLYRNGSLIATPSGTSYTNSGLSAGTSYSYTVAAYDTAGTGSDQSGALAVSTMARGKKH